MTSRLDTMFPENVTRRRVQQRIMRQVRAATDCEYIAHVGWCGPEHEKATKLEAELRAAAGIE